MKTICSKCNEEISAGPGGPVSHGLCRKCFMAQVREIVADYTLEELKTEIDGICAEMRDPENASNERLMLAFIDEIHVCLGELVKKS